MTAAKVVSYEFLGERPGAPEDLIGKTMGVGGERGTIVGIAAIGGVTPLLGPCAKVVYEDGAAPATIFPRDSHGPILRTWGDFS